MTPWVARGDYETTTQALADARASLASENAHVLRLRGLLQDETIRRMAADETADSLVAEMNQVKIALGRVAVYEGMVEVSPTVRLVDELVRDHEELEARIDAVLSYLTTQHQTRPEIIDEVARLLKGGTRMPDTIEEITPND